MSGAPHVAALIFDLDGTLVDTLDDIANAFNRVLAAHGLPVRARGDYRSRIGGGALQLVRALLPPEAQELAEVVLAEYRRDYDAHLLETSAPYPGIVALLQALSERSVPMCVLSNKPHAATQRIISALFSAEPFVEVVGERPGRPRKPDPQVALELAARMGVEPARCGLVGDTEIDLRTARAAGMRGFGAVWGFRAKGDLLAERPHALIERPEQLLAHVEQVTRR